MRKEISFWFLTTALIFNAAFHSLNAQSAYEELKKSAETEVTPPVPNPSPVLKAGEYGPSSKARKDWKEASALYSSKNFSAGSEQKFDLEGNSAVILQGFHWYADNYWFHPPGGWWGVLAGKAGEVGEAGFDFIWFPPVSRGSYYPTEWYDLDSQWGKKEKLLEAVQAMKTAGVRPIADIILNHRNGTKDWADFTSPDWPTTAVVKDDEWQSPMKSQNYDEGQGDWGCRDLDHKNEQVREDAKIFLRWLRYTIGFEGWRYDMVKGYQPGRVSEYNSASSPSFSVGEYYDTNRQLLVSWVDGTSGASTVFDFTTRYNLVAAVESERYDLLNDGGKPSGVIGWWPAKAVTFVENHDTSPRDENFITNAPAEYKTQRLMGYAYILTHPGTPSVFWPHFFDWGAAYKAKIQALIDLRKSAGITASSPVQVLAGQNELYAAMITGNGKYLVLKLGKNWGWEPGKGWKMETSGERYAVWSQDIRK